MTALQEAERLLPNFTQAENAPLAQRLSSNNIPKITHATSESVSDQDLNL